MGKVITLLKLLPRLHQIILSILVVITLTVVFLPSDDAQASRSTNSALSGSVTFSDEGKTIEQDAQAYPVPLAFRKPVPPLSLIHI